MAQRASQSLTDLRSAFDAAQHITELQTLSLAIDSNLGDDKLHFVDVYCTAALSASEASALAVWFGCSPSTIPCGGGRVTSIDLLGRSVQLRGLDLATAGATILDAPAPIAAVIVAPSSLDITAKEQVALLCRSFSVTPILFVGSSFTSETLAGSAAVQFTELAPRGFEATLAGDPESSADTIARSNLETVRRIATAAAHVLARQNQRCEAALILVKDDATLLQSMPMVADPVGPLSQELSACRKTLEAFVVHMFDNAGTANVMQLAPEDVEERDNRQNNILHSVGEPAMQRIRSGAFASYRWAIEKIGELLHVRLGLLKVHADRLLEDRGLPIEAAAPPSFYPARLLNDLEIEANAIRPPEQQTQRRTLKSQISMANPLMVVAPLLTAAGFWMSYLPSENGGLNAGDMRKVSFGIMGTVGALFLIYSMIAAFPRRRAQQEADREQAREHLTKGLEAALVGSVGQAKARALRAIGVHFELVDGWVALVKVQMSAGNSGGHSAMTAMTREAAIRAEIGDLAGRIKMFRSIAASAGIAS